MKYYAVERSSDSLSHYGVKGMRWGVRKRVFTQGNSGPKTRGYRKALNKLSALSSDNREIRKVQKAHTAKNDRKVSKMYKKASEKLAQLNEDANIDFHRGQYKQMKEDQSRMFWWSDDSKWTSGLGLKKNKLVRVMNRVDGRKSKKLTTKRGHAKAVKKRNDYEKHMADMFAGTSYGKQTKDAVAKRKRETS